MRIFRQLYRQAMKTLMGILTVALAVAVLCVSVGQTIAAHRTEQKLNSTFQTAAFPAAAYTEALDQWVWDYARENPQVIQRVAAAGLASGYIPQLNPDNYTGHAFAVSDIVSQLLPAPMGQQYSTAMLVVRLTEIGEPVENRPVGLLGEIMTTKQGRFWQGAPETESTVTLSLQGTVEGVIGLQEGYAAPVGYTANIQLTVPEMTDLEALELSVGEAYLVYTADYMDDWLLRSQFSRELEIPMFGAFDPEKLTVFDSPRHNGSVLLGGTYDFGNWVHGLSVEDVAAVRSVHFSVVNLAAIRDADYRLGENEEPVGELPGQLIPGDTEHFTSPQTYEGYYEFRPDPENPTPVYPVTKTLSPTKTYTNARGETVTVPWEEYRAMYASPTIVRLDGTAEEFLTREAGELWKSALEDIQIQNHSFPMIGVEKLEYIPDFLRGTADIVQGRNFTQEELETGAKVCILSESLAQANGLEVGDTLSVQLFPEDVSLPGQFATNVVNPAAFLYHSSTTRLEPQQSYTIVGLYRQDSPWGDVGENLYSFTPNTIFTPKTALPDWQTQEYRGLFRTILLQGSNMEQLFQAVALRGDEESFMYYDNGYGAVADSLKSYEQIAGRVFAIGLTVYGILALLFLLLYPGQQRRTLVAMERLGANRWQRIAWVEMTSLGILLPGTVLGTIAGALLWSRVVQALLRSGESTLAVEMEMEILAVVAAVQLAAMSLLVLLVGISQSRSRGISDRS